MIPLKTFSGLLLVASGVAHSDSVSPADVVDTYANIAQAGYEDALSTADELRGTITL